MKVNGKVIGYLGELHPQAISGHELGKNKVFAMEIDLGVLLEIETGQTVFKSFSRYPAIKRDLSFVVEQKVDVHQIMKTISSVSKMIKSVDIFDVYIGQGIPDGKKSIALTITYEDDEKTLKDEEVIEVEKKALDLLEKKFAVILRT